METDSSHTQITQSGTSVRRSTACAGGLLALMLWVLPVGAQSQDFSYTTNNGAITITGYTGAGGDVIIPSSINGLPVTSIGRSAFSSCSRLTNVNIGSGVTSIEGYAFSDCSGLRSITIPDSVTNIGNYAFCFCYGLTNVNIGNSVTSIGDSAFTYCTSLTSITIPDSVTSIGNCAFNGCSGLTNITAAAPNAAYSSVDGVLFNKNQTELIQYLAGKAGDTFAIPDSVTSIGDWAFYYLSRLTSITIPNSVTSIGGGAFCGCYDLTNAILGNSVTSIGSSAFRFCYALTSATIGNSVTSIGDSAFQSCSSLTGVYFNGNAPSVGSGVFYLDANIAFYLPGTTGWSSTFGGRPTAPWVLPYPVILDFAPSFGVQTDGFSFTISWATNTPVVVEASTNLANPSWSPVGTNTLTAGSSYFSDPQWANHPGRFYRLRSP